MQSLVNSWRRVYPFLIQFILLSRCLGKRMDISPCRLKHKTILASCIAIRYTFILPCFNCFHISSLPILIDSFEVDFTKTYSCFYISLKEILLITWVFKLPKNSSTIWSVIAGLWSLLGNARVSFRLSIIHPWAYASLPGWKVRLREFRVLLCLNLTWISQAFENIHFFEIRRNSFLWNMSCYLEFRVHALEFFLNFTLMRVFSSYKRFGLYFN